MSWTDFINHILATTHKIQKVAVLTEDGHPVAVTEDLQISLEEGQAISRCLGDPRQVTVSRLHLDNNFYTVFQGNNRTIIGTSPNRECIFVAHKEKDSIVIVFGRTKGHGSFLFELKKNLLVKDRLRQQGQIPLAGQGQLQQILQAAERDSQLPEADESQVADEMQGADDIQNEQMTDTFNSSNLADDQVLLQLHE